MTAERFRRLALALDGVVEASHMNHPDFRVGGKIFATLHEDLRTAMVKLSPEDQTRFIDEAPDAFSPEAGAWGRSGCTRVVLALVDEDLLGEAMTLAWRLRQAKTAPARRAPVAGAGPRRTVRPPRKR
jgi:hypothetical protein